MTQGLLKVLITAIDHPHYDRVGLLTGIKAKEGETYKEVILLPDGHQTLATSQQLKFIKRQDD